MLGKAENRVGKTHRYFQNSSISQAIAFSLGILFGSVADLHADNIDGNTLLGACDATADSSQQGFYVGYIIGVVEGLKYGAALPFMEAQAGISNESVNLMVNTILSNCTPPEVAYGQIRDIVQNYLRAHPETRHESVRTLALDALKESFP